MKTLRIAFCILSCLCVLAVVPAGIFWGWYCLLFVLGAGLFALGMLLCKRASEPKAPPVTDFMNTDEENEAIRRAQESKQNDHI